MNSSTKYRIEFLQQYLHKKYRKWHQIHSNNIVGFRIDKKVSSGKEQWNYCIVFQVKKKKNLKKLNEAEQIPLYFTIKFPDGITRKIKTDVEETGTPRFHVARCRKPRTNGTTEVGTAGVILRDGLSFFALTNYHVAARDLMLQGQFRLKGQDNNIFIDSNREVFINGIFSKEIDAAFIRMSNPPLVPNKLGSGNIIQGFLSGPLSSSLMGKEVVVYSPRIPNGRTSAIKTNSSVFFTDFLNLSLADLVQVRPRVTEAGDSGGAVVINGNILVGIVVGADDLSTYVVPFFKIHNFNPLSIA